MNTKIAKAILGIIILTATTAQSQARIERRPIDEDFYSCSEIQMGGNKEFEKGGCVKDDIVIFSKCIGNFFARVNYQYTGTDGNKNFCSGSRDRQTLGWVKSGETRTFTVTACHCVKTETIIFTDVTLHPRM